jgi:hypothetical protein
MTENINKPVYVFSALNWGKPLQRPLAWNADMPKEVSSKLSINSQFRLRFSIKKTNSEFYVQRQRSFE